MGVALVNLQQQVGIMCLTPTRSAQAEPLNKPNRILGEFETEVDVCSLPKFEVCSEIAVGTVQGSDLKIKAQSWPIR